MAKTAVAAIDQLFRESINLDGDDVIAARRSRDWLLKQVARWPNEDSSFPPLYPDIHRHYGSFARRTKIRELDDIDLMIGLMGLGTVYTDVGDGTLRLTVPEGIALRALCHDGSNYLNSRRVVNAFVHQLGSVPQYQHAEVKRNQQAATLKLASSPWSFDIVPSFLTAPDVDGNTYYVIPDGEGNWMRTDPRVDANRLDVAKSVFGGEILNVVRLIKFWNKRRSVMTMHSYLIECMVLDFYECRRSKVSARPEREVEGVFRHIASAVLAEVDDPKRIQGDLNQLTPEARRAISTKATEHANAACQAVFAQNAGDEKAAIDQWRTVFGTDLPSFG